MSPARCWIGQGLGLGGRLHWLQCTSRALVSLAQIWLDEEGNSAGGRAARTGAMARDGAAAPAEMVGTVRQGRSAATSQADGCCVSSSSNAGAGAHIARLPATVHALAGETPQAR